MKPLCALPIGALVGVSLLACGHAGPSAGSGGQIGAAARAAGTSSTRTSPRARHVRQNGLGDYDDDDGYDTVVRSDGDTDDNRKSTDADGDFDSAGGSFYDHDDSRVRAFGHAASSTAKRHIVALVESYYASAAAGDGARACSLIYSPLAKTFSQDLGQAGAHYLRGLKTCAAVVSKIFSENHPQLDAYAMRLGVRRVRVAGDLGVVVLGSGALPGRQIEVIREHGAWKIFALTDKELP